MRNLSQVNIQSTTNFIVNTSKINVLGVNTGEDMLDLFYLIIPEYE